ncbi:hypothetical protein EDEG_01499 [Edhazardia aedis USNM 41457]|uniref:Uncharacterized protein n=1 Tax=Edhazardia aedis (strain USNM 41457) TaxID=1003232 RepID=J8ZX15_EDHAE|nr:hypothetical protein EDEG_01499 [Edhazardia aedis USNM 41457]|eukprot:EJW04218.1 hypothetical protein EDEG_01499 [Edhazardia aedis USNM 41457]
MFIVDPFYILYDIVVNNIVQEWSLTLNCSSLFVCSSFLTPNKLIPKKREHRNLEKRRSPLQMHAFSTAPSNKKNVHNYHFFLKFLNSYVPIMFIQKVTDIYYKKV